MHSCGFSSGPFPREHRRVPASTFGEGIGERVVLMESDHCRRPCLGIDPIQQQRPSRLGERRSTGLTDAECLVARGCQPGISAES